MHGFYYFNVQVQSIRQNVQPGIEIFHLRPIYKGHDTQIKKAHTINGTHSSLILSTCFVEYIMQNYFMVISFQVIGDLNKQKITQLDNNFWPFACPFA